MIIQAQFYPDEAVKSVSKPFKVKSSFQPAGDQPEAIRQLVEGARAGLAAQTLLGVTGSGKTFTMMDPQDSKDFDKDHIAVFKLEYPTTPASPK